MILLFIKVFEKNPSYILGSILWTFRRWAFKLEDWLQRYWHKWQANGFSPVWILMWICKLAYDLARKLHIWQAWGFVSDLEVIFWYWNNIGYTSLRVIINHYCEIFLPFFQAFLKPNWIMILLFINFLKKTVIFWVRSCGLFVDAFLSWRIGYNRMCTNGRQTVFLQYGSSCEFLKGPYSWHENHTYGRHEVLRPKFFDTETI